MNYNTARNLINGGRVGITCELPASIIKEMREAKDMAGKYIIARGDKVGFLLLTVDYTPLIWVEISDLQYVANCMYGTFERMKLNYENKIKEALETEDTKKIDLLSFEINEINIYLDDKE